MRRDERKRTVLLLFILSLLFALCLSDKGKAQHTPIDVDVALVLLVDTSGSVSHERYLMQRDGYAEAFRDTRVIKALRSGPIGKIAVTMVNWGSWQKDVIPWTILSDSGGSREFSLSIQNSDRGYSGGTAVGMALDHGIRLVESPRLRPLRRVIDISGDGSNNEGASPMYARDTAIAKGITINGLPILANEPYLDLYYRDQVKGGPGSFIIPATSYLDFSRAIIDKLVLEISGTDRTVKFARR